MNFLATIGDALVGVAKSVLGTVMGPISGPLELIIKMAPLIKEVVSAVITGLASLIGVKEPNETTQDLGDRALQAKDQGVVRDRFTSNAEYVEALRQFELDAAKSAKLNPEEKEAAGLAVLMDGLNEKLWCSLSEIIRLVAAGAGWMDANRTKAWVDQAEESRFDIQRVVDYLEGRIGPSSSGPIRDFILNAEKRLNPDVKWEDVQSELTKMADYFQRR